MDGARAQALAYKGYAISARKSGLPFAVHRPVDATDPVGPATLVTTLPVLASADDYRMRRTNLYGKATWSLLLDGAQVHPGDYLVEVTPLPGQARRTFFIATMKPLLPILAVECNSVITVSRPGPTDTEGFGAVGYGGGGPETPRILSFPASLLAGTKGERADSGLPRDTRQPWYQVLIPALPGVEIRTDDELSDARGYSYLVSSAELTDLGWRLSVMHAGS